MLYPSTENSPKILIKKESGREALMLVVYPYPTWDIDIRFRRGIRLRLFLNWAFGDASVEINRMSFHACLFLYVDLERIHYVIFRLMKSFIVSCLCLIGCFVSAYSQMMTATLQSQDQTQVFYGYQSFIEAYNQSRDGDVITLSKGNFKTVGRLQKSITVVGNYAFAKNDDVTSLDNLTVDADNVTLVGIRFLGDLKMLLTNNLKIKRCYIETFTADTTHVRTLIEDCAVNNDFSLPRGVDECYRRCEIFRHHWANTPDNMAVFEYCTILHPIIEEINVCYPKGVKHWDNQLASYGTYRNCAIHSGFMAPGQSTAQVPLHLNTQSDYHDFLLFGGLYGYVSIHIPDGTLAEHVCGNFMEGDRFGELKDNFPNFYTDEIVIPMPDGMEYKAQAGCVGHKSYPAIPRIVESKIDKETDSEGKLRVEMKIALED